jgi:transcriptional regulator with GAF, ATPase, and Fis domain
LPSISISDDAIAYLQTLPYPGNVRELINIVDRAVDEMYITGDTVMDLRHVRSAEPPPQPPITGAPHSLRTAVDNVTRQSIEAALKRNRTQIDAAKELGITDRHLRNLMKTHRIQKEE